MNSTEIRVAMDGHLEAGYTETTIGWDNVEAKADNEFVRPTLNIFTAKNATVGVALGSGYVRRKGIYLINVHVPLQTGSGRAYEIADILDGLFGNKYINGVFTEAPVVNRVGDNGAGYYVVSVLIPFITDNTGS